MKTQRVTKLFGLILSLLGILAYFVFSHQESVTALIPTFFGLIILFLAFIESKLFIHQNKIMFLILLFSIFLLFGTLPGLMKIIPLLLEQQEFARPMAIKVQAITALLCLIYLFYQLAQFLLSKKNKEMVKKEL